MSSTALHPIPSVLSEITSHDIQLLNRYFSIKTLYDVDISCDEEAKQILQASLTDPPIRYAILSLRALREDLETFGDIPVSAAQQTPSYDHGLQQYCMALSGIASKLSSPGSSVLKSVLFCCQIFISIEQVRGDYAIMAKHIVQGLGIMRESQARPTLDAANELVPARHDQLPLLDVFIIKLFAAPCKFADRPDIADISSTMVPGYSASLDRQSVQSRDLCTIAPNMRTELTRIATSTITFLGKVSDIKTTGDACQMQLEKASLLYSLDSWFFDLERSQTEFAPPRPELISVSFMRLFYYILRLVLLGTLASLSSLPAVLQNDTIRLQSIASNLGERVKGYVLHNRAKETRKERIEEI
jgi:hypothetical protein